MRDDPLTQLLQSVGALQHIPKFRLPEQEYLQQGLATELEVGQHAQLFQRIHRQVLRFVDDQQATATSPRFGMKKFLDCAQQLSLVHMIGIDVEVIGGDAHDILAVQLRGHDFASGSRSRNADPESAGRVDRSSRKMFHTCAYLRSTAGLMPLKIISEPQQSGSGEFAVEPILLETVQANRCRTLQAGE